MQGTEGALRVPFLVRWPGHIPKGRVSNEIVHLMDLFPTLAQVGGGEIPKDRVIDGVDQTNFLTGGKDTSNRESFVIYVHNNVYGVKWRNWKMVAGTSGAPYGNVYNLLGNPKEIQSLVNYGRDRWVFYPTYQILHEHEASMKHYPPIMPGTPDPYHAPAYP